MVSETLRRPQAANSACPKTVSPLIHGDHASLPAFGTQVHGASKLERAQVKKKGPGSGFYGFSTSDLVTDEQKEKEGRDALQG